jgi:hypothetical protein
MAKQRFAHEFARFINQNKIAVKFLSHFEDEYKTKQDIITTKKLEENEKKMMGFDLQVKISLDESIFSNFIEYFRSILSGENESFQNFVDGQPMKTPISDENMRRNTKNIVLFFQNLSRYMNFNRYMLYKASKHDIKESQNMDIEFNEQVLEKYTDSEVVNNIVDFYPFFYKISIKDNSRKTKTQPGQNFSLEVNGLSSLSDYFNSLFDSIKEIDSKMGSLVNLNKEFKNFVGSEEENGTKSDTEVDTRSDTEVDITSPIEKSKNIMSDIDLKGEYLLNW